MQASTLLLLLAAAANVVNPPGTAAAPQGYYSGGGGSDLLGQEGSDFTCPMDMSVVLPAIDYTTDQLPCKEGGPGGTPNACRDLRDKVALITGGSTGIGRGTADRLHKAGMTVIGTSRAPQNYTQDCSSQGDTYQNPGDLCKPVGWELWQLDQTQQSSVDALIQKFKSQHNQIDFLFLNAGRGYGSPIFGDMYQKCQLYDAMQLNFDTNYWGTVRMLEAARPLLAPDALVLLTSSVNSFVLVPGSIAYTADKRGVNALAEEWMSESFPRGYPVNGTAAIRVSTLYPGNIKTDVIRDSTMGSCPIPVGAIESLERASYFSKGVPVMDATQAGESVYRIVVDPKPPLRVLMNPKGSVGFMWKRICRHLAAPMEAWVPSGWDRPGTVSKSYSP